MKCPTPEECTNNTTYDDEQGLRWMACWYPQMGGNVVKCLVCVGIAARIDSGEDCSGECFEAYAWFNGGSSEQEAANFHYCDAYEFIEFGENVARAQGAKGESKLNHIPLKDSQ